MYLIMMQLLTGKKFTAKQLAKRYEVSERSVYRYVEDLNVSGVPVDVERGRYGGISIADTFRLPCGYFSREEYTAVINAIDAMSSQIDDENLIAAREKLERSRKNERLDEAVCGNIIVDGGAWGDIAKFSDKMRVCEQAVNECKSLSIDYISRGGEHSRRVIDPHVLVFKQNVWYVYAFCHSKQEFRTFKIGRIKSASFTGETFRKTEIRREDIELDFRTVRGRLAEVVLEIRKDRLADAEEWLGIDNIEPRGNALVASITLPDDELSVNKILSYGGAVRVLSPEGLKERVREAALKIAEDIR